MASNVFTSDIVRWSVWFQCKKFICQLVSEFHYYPTFKEQIISRCKNFADVILHLQNFISAKCRYKTKKVIHSIVYSFNEFNSQNAIDYKKIHRENNKQKYSHFRRNQATEFYRPYNILIMKLLSLRLVVLLGRAK